jgi:PadR family transcriptional regulator PadR
LRFPPAETRVVEKPNVAILQGTLDALILKTLSWQPMHGYGVVRSLRVLTDDTLQIEEGTLYPALHRMERKGWIESDWGTSENNRRAKFYTITTAGRRQLRAEVVAWGAIVAAVGKVLTAAGAPA